MSKQKHKSPVTMKGNKAVRQNVVCTLESGSQWEAGEFIRTIPSKMPCSKICRKYSLELTRISYGKDLLHYFGIVRYCRMDSFSQEKRHT